VPNDIVDNLIKQICEKGRVPCVYNVYTIHGEMDLIVAQDNQHIKEYLQ